MSDTWLFLYCIKGVALFLLNRLNIAEYAQISLLFKSEIASLHPSSVAVQPSVYQTWSEGFLTTRLSCVKCVVLYNHCLDRTADHTVLETDHTCVGSKHKLCKYM